MKPFRFGVQFAHSPSADAYREAVRKLEDLGYSTVYCPDHFGDQWAPTVAITVAAECTTTLTVGSFVYDVDYRHPVVLAKEIASLDCFAQGRVEFGIGAGWMRTDYDVSGIAYDRPGVRIDRMIEAIKVIKGHWSGQPFSFAGEHYTVTNLVGRPLPHNEGGPPIVIGGGAKRMLSEAARLADIVGFNPSLHEGRVGPEAVRSALAERFVERRAWVEAAAGDRLDDVELQMNTFIATVTDNRDELFRSAAPAFGMTPEEAAETPIVLAGTVDQICDQLARDREIYGTSYIVVRQEETDSFAPVVARLAGT